MDHVRLKYFLAVMEHKNFARAAEHLRVSQPAVTHAVSKLEKELMVKLFDRGRFGAVPTEYALTLEHRARLIMAEVELARGDMAAMRGAKKGRLTIGVGISFTPRLVPKTLGEFVRRWPDVGVQCVEGNTADLQPQLLNGELDAMMTAPGPFMNFSDELVKVPLFTDHDYLTVRAGHPLARDPALSFEKLRHYPWLVTRNLGLWKQFRHLFQGAGLNPPETLVEMKSATLGLAILQHSDCIALLGHELSHAHIDRGELTTLSFPEFETPRQAFFSYRQRSPLKLAAKNFLTVLKKNCRELHGRAVAGS